ncbi:MAG TPA: NUDIX hydrolase [Candidatus Saccharimonadales bacterium]|nr:NUDIX hydrolase [Candidatus Saccharimonadales bacterium]
MLDEIVSKYLKLHPEERDDLMQLILQIANEDELNNRKTMPGHVTGSAIVLSEDRSQLLIIHHKFLDMWLQPGGHWEPDEPDPWTAAQREAEEETGVQIAEMLPANSEDPRIPFDINSHPIPEQADKNEPAHVHHDFRYIFIAKDDDLTSQEAEVHAAAFVDFDDPRTEHVRPIIEKLIEQGIIAA